MKNFHVPLPDDTYNTLRDAAESSRTPATVLAREAIETWLKQEMRRARHAAIADYAAGMAGTSHDLDQQLEAASIRHVLDTGKRAK